MVKAVLFDMDGVLIDSETHYVDGIFDWISKLGYQDKKEGLHVLIGHSSKSTYEKMSELVHGKYTPEELETINDSYFEKHPLKFPDILKPGAREVLEALKLQGKKIGLCSSSPIESIQNMLRGCDLTSFFDVVISGDQFKESKPNPEIYLHAAEVIGVKPEECLVVEDSFLGIESGCRAEMTVLALIDERFGQNQERANKKIRHLLEILEWLELDQ